MTTGVRSLRSIILALLVLVVVSGTGSAGGSLFGGEYSDYPFRTRLRNGQISGLSLSRASDREDEVNVSWTAIDPASWGLGSNTYRTSLVVMIVAAGNEPHLFFDDARKLAVATQIVEAEIHLDALSSLNPPSSLDEIHNLLMMAVDENRRAIHAIMDGVDNLNDAAFVRATELVGEARWSLSLSDVAWQNCM